MGDLCGNGSKKNLILPRSLMHVRSIWMYKKRFPMTYRVNIKQTVLSPSDVEKRLSSHFDIDRLSSHFDVDLLTVVGPRGRTFFEFLDSFWGSSACLRFLNQNTNCL